MKRKRFYFGLYTGLGLLGLTLLGLQLAQLRWAGVFTDLVNAPYEQLGLVLRWLSLRGGWADTAAWCFYLALGLLPLVPLGLRLKAHRKPGSAFFGLPVGGVVLVTLYYMVNPSMLQRWQRMLLTGTADSLLVLWLTIWAMERLGRTSSRGQLQSLKWLLAALDGVLVIGICGTAPTQLLEVMKSVAKANTGVVPEELALTNGFLVANALVGALPLALDILLIHRVLVLLETAGEEPFGTHAAQAARRLAMTARWVVCVQAVVQVGFQLAQLAVSSRLHSTAVSVNVPLFSIAFGVAAMILAQWMSRGQEIREENDSFI